MTATRVSHSPVMARNVHSDEEGPRSSREVSLWVKGQVQINGVHGQAQAWLAAPQQPNLTFCQRPPGQEGQPWLGLPTALWQPLPHGTTMEGGSPRQH